MADPQRYGRQSPRTPELPMAFSAGEFLRGALLAWAAFLLLFPLWLTVYFAIAGAPSSSAEALFTYGVMAAVVGVIYAFPWTLGALLLGSPLALLLGLALRRVRALWPHLLLFLMLGALIGTTTVAIATFTPVLDSIGGLGSDLADGLLGALLIGAPATAIAVPLGWWITAALALRADARRSAPSPVAAWDRPAA